MQEIKIQLRRLSLTMRGMSVFCCCALLVLAFAGVSYGQAGRRVQKPKSDPPVPKPAEIAAPVNAPTPELVKTSLLVGGSMSVFRSPQLGAADNLPGVVGRRLQDSKSLQVASGGDMTRGEANKRAKNEATKTFVVWLELQGNGFDFDPRNRSTRFEDLSVRYVILEPGTAKMRDQGTVYLRSVNRGILGGVGRLPSCYPQPASTFEYALTVAGIETAERILREFSLSLPPLCS